MPLLKSEQKTAGLFLLAVIVIGAVLVGDILHFRRYQSAIKNVMHTQQSLETMYALLNSVQAAETGQRGYLLTGRPDYLAPFIQGKARVPVVYEKLRNLVEDSPAQRQSLERIHALEERKIAELQRTIDLKMSRRSAVALEELNTDKGKTLMDQIRDELDRMESRERIVLQERNVRLEIEKRRREALIGVGTAVSVFLLLWMMYLLRQEISRRQKSQERLEDTRLQLERHTTELSASNKELEAFCYSVSHDLRAPLRGIEGFSRVVIERYKDVLDAEGIGYLERVRTGVKRMGQLIDDLLRLSRITRAEIRKQPIDLTEIAVSVAEELNKAQPGANIEWKIAPALPVTGDPVLLRTVLENLMGNAWKFTSKKESAHVEVGQQPIADGGAYFVRDDGAGFDMAYQNKLFSAFQRLHSPGEFPGTGIGLATVQRVIHRHGGRVWAEGAVEQGATFYFTLP